MASYTGYSMASLYKRPQSPFWYIKYKDEAGKQQAHSTGFRHAIPAQTKKARVLQNEKQLRELKSEKGSEREGWNVWVGEFLNTRYAEQQKTLHRYKTCWQYLHAYLQEKGILYPQQLTFKDCEKYMAWRMAGQPQHGFYKCGHNTARLDLKILHLICGHAIKRGYIAYNPCASLGIGRHASPEKPELTDDDIALIREQLVTLEKPEWMKISFEIAIHQGCRLSETSFPLSRVDWKRKTIEFYAKRNQRYTAPIHSELLPILKRLKSQKQEITCEIPKMASKEWWRFFKKIGLHQKGVCFHCTRVTVITRLIRAGVPENQVQKIVHHASTEVHRIYQRLGVDDVRPALDALKV
ncbi:MAG: tyrosine-type recombinase/integrase [Deltaproteobacteria bacterium]